MDDLISSIIIIDNSELLLYADKEEVSRKLFFSTGEVKNEATVIYAEQTPQGEITRAEQLKKLWLKYRNHYTGSQKEREAILKELGQ